MADMKNEIPSKTIQRRETRENLAKPLVCNDTWYMVHAEWFRSYKSFIGFENEGERKHDHEHPGPIDNSALYDEDDPRNIKENLLERVDYVLVPEKLWNLLVFWYGIVEDQRPIPRKVVQMNRFNKNCVVEVYLVELRLAKDFDMNIEYMHKFSKADTVAHIATVVRHLFNIDQNIDIKLWGAFNANTYSELNFDSTIEEESLYKHQMVFVEVRRPDGKWIGPTKNNLSNRKGVSCAGPSITKATRYHTYGSCSTDTRSSGITPGLCGLCNLGNTCFMNSVIQCISNCPPVAKHFVDDEYLKDINTVNPLGMKGQIADSFGELIKVMWSGRTPLAVPNKFKLQVGRFAPQFSGYQQHDSQELLTFLLDGLHEDLNKVKEKPYIETKDSDGRSDEVLAQEAWENYLRRNDSIIVDNFHGLLKSTVVCPDCSKVSVTFDPFVYLSLPLPMKKDKQVEVKFFPSDSEKRPQFLRVTVPKNGHIRDLLLAVNQLCGLSPDDLLVAEISKHHFHKFFAVNDTLEGFEKKENIAVYEVPHMETHVPVPAVLWEVKVKQTFNFSQLFGYPMILMLPQHSCTYEHLFHTVLDKMSRYLILPEGTNIWDDKLPQDDYATPEPDPEGPNAGLFSLHIINAPTTSVVHRLHNDGNIIRTPFSETLGRQYLAIQWTSQKRLQYLNNEAVCDIEDHESCMRKEEPHNVHLTDCIELFTVCETLGATNAWYCPVCKTHQRASKKIDLWSLPTILIIQLKRFSFIKYKHDKLNAHVEFPLEDLDMAPFIINPNHPPAKYKLIGVCNHYGTMGGGHYTAFALNKINKNWYNFDDQNVSNVHPDGVCTNSAYVLFYMRCD